jgi:hypothetical protein
LIGNLLVLASGRYKQQGFSFPRRQGVEAIPQFGTKFGPFAPGSIALECRIKQLLCAHGFGAELDSAQFRRHGNVAMAADEYDRKLDPRLRQRTLKFQSTRPRQSDVEHDATGQIGAPALKEFLRRPG